MLVDEFGKERLVVDGKIGYCKPLDPAKAHDIEIEVGSIDSSMSKKRIREAVHHVTALGAGTVKAHRKGGTVTFATTPVCSARGHRSSRTTD